MTKLSQRCGGIFTPDTDTPPDHRGKRFCICGLAGQPDDAHHTLPDVPEQEEHRRRIGDIEEEE